jgi:hypothetical protein
LLARSPHDTVTRDCGRKEISFQKYDPKIRPVSPSALHTNLGPSGHRFGALWHRQLEAFGSSLTDGIRTELPENGFYDFTSTRTALTVPGQFQQINRSQVLWKVPLSSCGSCQIPGYRGRLTGSATRSGKSLDRTALPAASFKVSPSELLMLTGFSVRCRSSGKSKRKFRLRIV